MPQPVTLAHLTDLHLPLHGRFAPSELLGKRALSALNWLRKRRAMHRPEIAEALAADIARAAPDHVAVTGDVANFGLPREFAAGAAWLSRLGAPEDVSFVPGNHEAIQSGEEAALAAAYQGHAPGGWPFLRRIDHVALIGVSTSIATRAFLAEGAVGKVQLTRLEELLTETRGAARVILIHHPPAGPCKRGKRLRDAAAFAKVVGRAGAELILHGHTHKAQMAWIDGAAGRIPVFGAPSASIGQGRKDDPAEWRLWEIAQEDDGFALTMNRRRIRADLSLEDWGCFRLVSPPPRG